MPALLLCLCSPQPHLDQTLAKLTARLLQWAALLHCLNAVWQYGTPGLLAQAPLSAATSQLAAAVLPAAAAARAGAGGSVLLALLGALLGWALLFRATALALLRPVWRGVIVLLRAHCRCRCARRDGGGALAWLLRERRVESEGIASYTDVFRHPVETTTAAAVAAAAAAAAAAAVSAIASASANKEEEEENQEEEEEKGEEGENAAAGEQQQEDGTATDAAELVPLHPLTRKQRQAGWLQKFDPVSGQWCLFRQFMRGGKANGVAYEKDQLMRTWQAMMGLSTYRILANGHYALALKGSIFESGMGSATALAAGGGAAGAQRRRGSDGIDLHDPGVYDDDEAGDEGGADGPLALDAIDDMDYEQLERELAALEEGEGGEGGEHDPKKKKKKAKKSSGGRKKKKVLPASDDEF